jgi:hypothetical protein
MKIGYFETLPHHKDENKSMRKQSDPQPLSSSVQEKIEQANRLYRLHGDTLRRDPSISSLLREVQSCIDNTNMTMLAYGVVSECKHCEEEEGGSCCGMGIENKYEPALLLINRLMGISLPTQGQSQNSCCFLRENGCLLAARHVLCVNYICEKLRNKLTREELIGLQSCAGEELDRLFFLHEAIKKYIRTQDRCSMRGL